MDHQRLGSMPSRRIGLAEARASGSHRSPGGEEVQEDSPAEGLQLCGNLWQVEEVGSRSTYRVEGDSFGKDRLPCTEDIPVALSNPWRAEFYRSRVRRCGVLRDACFLRG